MEPIVFVCEHCGTGFLRMPPTNGQHSFPVWSVGIEDGPQGPICDGAILPMPRAAAIRMVEQGKR